MMNWSDRTWGKNGADLWLVKLGQAFIHFITITLLYVLIEQDFEDALLFLISTLFAFLYVLHKSVFILQAIPKVKKQLVNVTKGGAAVTFQCYFGKEQVIQNEQLVSLEKCDYSFWYLHFSYLSGDLPNYCLTTKEGQKFYISGDMPEVDSLIQALQSIIEQNKES